MKNIAVEARGLGKIVQDATGSLTILDDINLSIAAGETASIVGASGSGKSTLLGLLAGLDVPTSGAVRIFGDDMFTLDEDGRAALRARAIGFVFQSFQLLPHLTALENVLLPLELTGRTPEGEEPVAAARAARPRRSGGTTVALPQVSERRRTAARRARACVRAAASVATG